MRDKMFSFSMFFLSFFPLWLSVLFIDITKCIENSLHLWTERIGIGCIILFSIICFVITKNELKTSFKGFNKQKVISAKEKKTITSEYLLSYILPLFAFNFTLWNEVVLFLIFFFTLGYLCIRHNHFSVNIILEIFGYRVYDCQIVNEDGIQMEYEVISRRKLNACIGEEIPLRALNNDYKLDNNK